MPSRLEIVQRAQARIGDEPIASETAAGASTHLAIYDDVRDDLLSRYPWKFATLTRRLGRLSATPELHWRYFYQMPADMLGAPRAIYNSSEQRLPFIGYEILQNRLATDAEAIWMRFQRRAEPEMWPGYFTSIVTKATMRELALSVREDRVLYETLGVELFGSPGMLGAGGLVGQAMALDAQSGPSPVIAEGSNPLIEARY